MLADLQRLLVHALREPDPRGWLDAQLRRTDHGLTVAEHAWLRNLPEDGLRMTRVLTRKLRLQRLLEGDPQMARLCREQPAEFARRFAAYEAAVPATAVSSAAEAAHYAAHLQQGGDAPRAVE